MNHKLYLIGVLSMLEGFKISLTTPTGQFAVVLLQHMLQRRGVEQRIL